MRKIVILSIVLCTAFVYGCDAAHQTEGDIGTTVKTANDSPEAKNAPVAPRDPSIQGPGGGAAPKVRAPETKGGATKTSTSPTKSPTGATKPSTGAAKAPADG